MGLLLCLQDNIISLSTIISIMAFGFSIISLFVNIKISQRNTRLTIQQAVFKTVIEKAKDCNTVWVNEPAEEFGFPTSPHFLVISEVIISIETIERSIKIFERNYSNIGKENSSDFYYVFWKQLRVDLRGWIKTSPLISEQINDEIYSNQIKLMFSKFKSHFE